MIIRACNGRSREGDIQTNFLMPCFETVAKYARNGMEYFKALYYVAVLIVIIASILNSMAGDI